jgi:hypothetical protein
VTGTGGQMSLNLNPLLIGRGRLARHLKQLLAPYPFSVWNRDQSFEDLQKKLKEHQIVYLCISDAALEEFFETHLLPFKNTKVVHFSGSLAHPHMLGAHPLMTFGRDLREAHFYQSIYWGLEPSVKPADLFPFPIENFFHIQSEHKAAYHALVTLSGNGACLLYLEALKRLSQLGVPATAFQNFFTVALQNITQGNERALTGPVIRNDLNTLQKNQQALESEPELAALYEKFNNYFLKQTWLMAERQRRQNEKHP